MLKNEKGSSLVELVMVMMLLILFGATIYTIIFMGSSTQDRIIKEKDAQIEARIAISYINVRLRQNDAQGKISIMQNPVNNQNSIVIHDNYEGTLFDTWIYWSDGVLKECLVYPGEEVTDEPGMYTPIANISGFDIQIKDDGSLYNKVTYEFNGKTKTLENAAFLRAGADF